MSGPHGEANRRGARLFGFGITPARSSVANAIRVMLIASVATAVVLLSPLAAAAESINWGLPVNVSAASQNADGPQITGSSDGKTLTAIWRRFDGSHYIVQTATSTDTGATWSSPVNLSYTFQNADGPQITGSSDGAALTATWYRYNGSTNIVQTATSTDTGATWSSPVDLSAAGQNADGPQITGSSDGTALTATWLRFDGSNQIVQAATSTDTGATWSSPVNLSAAGQNADGPQITSSSDGATLTATWRRFDGSNNIVQAATGIVAAALTPTLAAPTSMVDGFTVQVTNYDSDYTWAATVTAGSATISSSGLVTVTGLTSGQSATVTVTATRTGYDNGSAQANGSAIADTDGDGVSDAQEAINCTDPNKADTDGDGKNDGDEGTTDSDNDGTIDALESSVTDTDNDGVSDERDSNNTSGDNDTDGDGVSNADEVAAGTDPMDSDSIPVTEPPMPVTTLPTFALLLLSLLLGLFGFRRLAR